MNNSKNTYLQRAVISINGVDSYGFLQNLISNDLGKATEENSIYTYLLTPQGKYIFDFFVIKNGNDFLIDISADDKESFLKKLKMYKLRSAVEISDLSATHNVYLLKEKGGGYQDPRNENLPNRLIANKNSVDENTLVSAEEYHRLRVENNIPEGEFDLEKEASFPLHYRMIELNGVDFKKGCYVGQEVTARTHHRGVIRKTTYVVEAAENLENMAGAEVKSGNNIVGKILSTSGSKALALLEKEVAENKTANLIVNEMQIALKG